MSPVAIVTVETPLVAIMKDQVYTHKMLLMICVSTGLGCSCLQTPSARLGVYVLESGCTRLLARMAEISF